MKYIIKFKKQGKIRFISHLDLQKVFLRLFRIIGIKPKYSNGYNPHPKLSFAMPLSLGFSSDAEYMELETEVESGFDIKNALSNLKEYLPDGLTVEYIKMKPENLNKKLASYMDRVEYTVISPYFPKPDEHLNDFLNQKNICYEKTSRKSNKITEINIKPMIHELSIVEVNCNNITLHSVLHAGSDSVLNPNVLMDNLFIFSGLKLDFALLNINRNRVYCRFDDKILDVDDIFSF